MASANGVGNVSPTSDATFWRDVSADPSSLYDFTRMSRNEMRTVARSLWNAEVLTLDQLGMLEMSGPLGKVGPAGEFVPFTDGERAVIDRQPRDHLSMVRGAIDFIEQQGRAADPTSGYANWQEILRVLTSRSLPR